MILIQEQAQNSFLYDHGVNLFASIVTFLAFLLTFISLYRNFKQEKEEKRASNDKTLYMIDLILEQHKEELKKDFLKIKEIKDSSEYKPKTRTRYDGKEVMVYDFFEVTIPNRPPDEITTRFKEVKIILQIYTYLNKVSFKNKIKNYKEDIKEIIRSQHLNLNSSSLEKVTKRIEHLNENLIMMESFEINMLHQMTYIETNEYFESEIKRSYGKSSKELLYEEYMKFESLEKSLEEINKNLIDNKN